MPTIVKFSRCKQLLSSIVPGCRVFYIPDCRVWSAHHLLCRTGRLLLRQLLSHFTAELLYVTLERGCAGRRLYI